MIQVDDLKLRCDPNALAEGKAFSGGRSSSRWTLEGFCVCLVFFFKKNSFFGK